MVFADLIFRACELKANFSQHTSVTLSSLGVELGATGEGKNVGFLENLLPTLTTPKNSEKLPKTPKNPNRSKYPHAFETRSYSNVRL